MSNDAHIVNAISQAEAALGALYALSEYSASEDTELATTYTSLKDAAEQALVKLYGVRDDVRAVLRASGCSHGFDFGERDH